MFYADNFCTYEEKYTPKHVYVYSGPCKVTGKIVSVEVPADGLYQYRQGKFIQDAFPEMSNADREFLISGYSKEGWDKTFPPEDEVFFRGRIW